MDWKEYYDPRKIFIFGKFMLLFNLLVFVANLQRLPFVAALLVLISTVSCTLPFMLQHRQKGIVDAEYLRRVIVPSFLGLTVSVLLLSLLSQWMSGSYGLSHYEVMGKFFNNRGMFFLVMSNFIFVQMIMKEAIPSYERRPYWVLLMIPLVLLAIV
jgi:hypothetical protein